LSPGPPHGPQKKEKEKEKCSAPIVMAITQLGIGCFIGFGKFFVVHDQRFLAFPTGPRPGTRLPPRFDVCRRTGWSARVALIRQFRFSVSLLDGYFELSAS
jgi:hypothetical protein